MNPSGRALAWGVLVGLGASLIAGASLAQSGGDAALAETLFQDGKKLMEAEKYGDGCPKLAESHKLDPSGGTVLVLAVCYEKAGRTASAWATYEEALSFARRDHREEREQRAKDRIAALEPKLSRLTVRVAPEVASLAGVVILRDGTPLPRAAWGVAVPVDPGEHVVEVSADAHEKAIGRVTVGREGDAKELLAPTPSAMARAAPSSSAPSTDSPPPREEPRSSRGTVGVVVLGASAVALGVGTVFGLRALSKQSDAKQTCPDTRCADATAVSANDSARSAALVADVSFALGLIGAGVGTYLLVSKPSSTSSARVWMAPTAGPQGGGLAAGGAW